MSSKNAKRRRRISKPSVTRSAIAGTMKTKLGMA